jgi:hypothetical protein
LQGQLLLLALEGEALQRLLDGASLSFMQDWPLSSLK